MALIKFWLTAEETHQYSNALAVHFICEGDNSADVLDVNKNKAFTLQEFTDDLDKVENLKNKPKLIMLQKCSGKPECIIFNSYSFSADLCLFTGLTRLI